MSGTPAANPNAIADDLLKEKSLWAIYCQSRRIPRSKTNLLFGLAFCILVAVLASRTTKLAVVADQMHAFAGIVFSSAISLLGFLIAGFSFFATVSDKKMFCRMAEFKHKESGLSYLKYNLFAFMRIFGEYLALSLMALVVIIVLQPGSVCRASLREWLNDIPWLGAGVRWRPDILACAIGFGLLTGSFVYAIMQLKSFIFNVYHVVMTTIRWEMEEEQSNG